MTQSLEDAKQEITRILSFSRGTRVNICYMLYAVIKDLPNNEQPNLLRFTCDIFDEVESSEEVPVDMIISHEDSSEYQQRFAKIVDAMLESLIAKNPTEDDFYQNLWNFLSNPLFGDDKARAFALYWVLIDRKIPYFQVDSGLRMPNADYLRLKQQLVADIKKVIFILSREFEQRTEKADVLAKHILEHESEEERAILIDTVLAFFEVDIKRLRRAAD